MKRNRRDFLKKIGLIGAGVLLPGKARPSSPDININSFGVLVDTTLCIGCRMCELACNEANELAEPKIPFDDDSVFEKKRKTDENTFAVINSYQNPKDPGEPVYSRIQCMHCLQPACATACLVKSMQKKANGAVVWNEENCIGCRYCMICCPFDIPKYEYHSVNPRVRKCTFCYQRQDRGLLPACVESCPSGALLFGKRTDLLETARTRIYKEPDKYVHHIYGEHEIGGTSWLYLSSVPFEKLGFKTDLGVKPLPELTAGFLNGVSQVLVLWPALLLGLHNVSKNGGADEDKEREVKK